jgi:hypothetical protein
MPALLFAPPSWRQPHVRIQGGRAPTLDSLLF